MLLSGCEQCSRRTGWSSDLRCDYFVTLTYVIAINKVSKVQTLRRCFFKVSPYLCALDISRSFFFVDLRNPPPHSSPVRARYGVSFLNAKPDRSFTIIAILLCVLTSFWRPRYIESLEYHEIHVHTYIIYQVEELLLSERDRQREANDQ